MTTNFEAVLRGHWCKVSQVMHLSYLMFSPMIRRVASHKSDRFRQQAAQEACRASCGTLNDLIVQLFVPLNTFEETCTIRPQTYVTLHSRLRGT